MADRAVRLIVEGRVQGVGFRYWTVQEATRRGLDGWVRNLPDGSVEALIAGPEDAVAAMIEACRRGPSMAAVRAVHQHAAAPPGAPGFRQVG
ncbi:MAG: acylphosphatase [Alphaproteobacteria bacterium]